MEHRIKSFLQHKFNSGHIYCRLNNLVGKMWAAKFCRWYSHSTIHKLLYI